MINSNQFIDIAKHAVLNYVCTQLDPTERYAVNLDNIYVVWFCKTLQNWKALLSTTLPDEMYYELTYNGDKQEYYLDAYKKWENIKTKFTFE